MKNLLVFGFLTFEILFKRIKLLVNKIKHKHLHFHKSIFIYSFINFVTNNILVIFLCFFKWIILS